jgi:hypothetical protein
MTFAGDFIMQLEFDLIVPNGSNPQERQTKENQTGSYLNWMLTIEKIAPKLLTNKGKDHGNHFTHE